MQKIDGLGEKPRVVLNTLISGGPDAEETIKGAMAIMDATEVPILLWLNAHLGPLEIGGFPIQDADFLAERQARILGTVVLHQRTQATFGKDIRDMLSKRLTFEEAMRSFDLMPRTRIKRLKEDVWGQLDEVALPGGACTAKEAAG